MTDSVLFIAFPYVAVVVAVAGGVYRYFADRFSYSSMSSQFLENRMLFWGSVPFHYGIVIILLGHIMGGLFPYYSNFLIVNVFHMYTLELGGIALGLLTNFGVILLIIRRLVYPKLVPETTLMDWVILLVLLAQVLSGSYIAHFYRWGAVWYPYSPVPWLKSLAHLDPQIDFITPLPWIIRFHALNAFVIVGLIPFTRLVHIFTAPVTYIWRPLQVVIWNKKAAR